MISRKEVRRRLTGLAACALVVAGCSTDLTIVPSAAVTAAPLPTPTTTTYDLSAIAWYAGLLVHFDGATSILDEGGGLVTLELRLENPGEEVAALGAPLWLAWGKTSAEPVRGTALPDIPAASSASVTVPFDVDATFASSLASFRIGREKEHVVVIPLEAGSLQPVTLEPRSVELSGSATVGSLSIELSGAVLRADLPDWGLEEGADLLALTVTYSARYVGSFSGGFAFTGANIGLRLPDGSIIDARDDGHSQSVVALAPGITVPDLASRFDVPLTGSGSYALIIRDGSRSVPLAFTIEEPAPGG